MNHRSSDLLRQVSFFVGLVCLVASPALAANKAKVELLSSKSAVAAGQPFDVALKFTIEKDWHIYWKNAGDSGLPPKVEWKLPDGFDIGELRFPIPKSLRQSGIVTNILEDQPVLLATVTPPASLTASGNITFSADIKWLVCDKQCLREDQSVTLSLPIESGAFAAAPANEKIFKRARRLLPAKDGKGKYLTVTPSLASGTVAPNAKFEIALDVAVKRGIHIQSDKPLIAGLIATEVFTDPQDAIFFDPPKFPAAKVRVLSGIGKLSEFEGNIRIQLPAEADVELPADSVTLGGILVYQACNEKGICFPKEGVEWSFDVPIGQVAAPGDSEPTALASTDSDPAEGSTPPAEVAAPPPTETQTAAAQADGEQGFAAMLKSLGLPGLLLACFIYGLALNATPCVLPLLSIKVLGFVQQAHESRKRTLALGLAFGAGVMLFFVILGLLAAAGKNILHYPAAVIALGAIVLALSLSMLGVYTLQVPTAATKLDARIQKEGVLASFGKGALAPVLGFACTGPLLAFAFGWAAQQPPNVAILAFLFGGLGMAGPYMLLGANPNWLSFLPKPGNWMITFERIMGFLLLGMLVILIHPLITQVGAEGLEWTLGFFVAIGMGCWVYGKINFTMTPATQWRYRGAAGAIVLVSGVAIYGWLFPLGEAVIEQEIRIAKGDRPSAGWDAGIPWRPWSAQAVEETVRSGKTVFVDFTSASCTNCKINKKVAINTPEFKAKLQKYGVVPFQGDFTTGDEDVFEELQRFGQLGPPLNMFYPAGKPEKPIVLSTLFTLDQAIEKLAEAGPSKTDVLASAPAP